MPLSIADLDALTGYDPETHSIGSMPSVRPAQPARRLSAIPTVNTAEPGNEDAALASMLAPSSPKSPYSAVTPLAMPNARAAQPQQRAAIPQVETSAPVMGPSSADLNALTGSSFAPPKPKESTWQKIKHGLATAGNIAGDILAPGVTAMIPGTQLHNEFEEARNARLAQQKAQTGQTEANTQDIAAQTWQRLHPEAKETEGDWRPITGTNLEENAKTGEAKPIEGMAAPPPKQTDTEFMDKAEEDLSKGTITQPDRERLAGMQRAQKMQGVPPEIGAQVGQSPVPADFPKGTNDPGYTRAEKTWGQQIEALKKSASAMSAPPIAPQGGMQNPIVQAILEGRMPMPSSFAMKTPYWEGIMQAVAAADPQFSVQRAQLRQAYTTGRQSQEINAINTSLGHVGALGDAIDALNNGDVQALNRIANAYDVQVGETPVTTLRTIVNRVGPELVRAYSGAAGGEEERKQVEADFDPKNSPSQLKQNVGTTVRLLRSKISSLENQWDQNKGPGMPSFQDRFIMPAADDVLGKWVPEKGGGKAGGGAAKDFGDAGGKPEGSTGMINGQKVIVNGGRIVLQ